MTTLYNLAFFPEIHPEDESKSVIHFFKCTTVGTGVYNHLQTWENALKYQSAFSIPFPQRGERYQGKHIDNRIANIIKGAHDIEKADVFFISYLNGVLISTIMSSGICDDSAFKNIEMASRNYSLVPKDQLIIERQKDYVLAIGIGLETNNLRLLCIKRDIVETPITEISEFPILTYTSFNQLFRTYGRDIVTLNTELLPRLYNPYECIIDEYNILKRLTSNVYKINKGMSLDITQQDMHRYAGFTKKAIVMELIEREDSSYLNLH